MDISNFDSVFAFDPKYKLPKDKLSEIAYSIKVLNGKTFFERLLEEAGVQSSKKECPSGRTWGLILLQSLVYIRHNATVTSDIFMK